MTTKGFIVRKMLADKASMCRPGKSVNVKAPLMTDPARERDKVVPKRQQLMSLFNVHARNRDATAPDYAIKIKRNTMDILA